MVSALSVIFPKAYFKKEIYLTTDQESANLNNSEILYFLTRNIILSICVEVEKWIVALY